MAHPGMTVPERNRGGFQFQTATLFPPTPPRSRRAIRASFAIHEAHLKFRGRRECRALDAPAASHAKIKKHTSIVTTVAPDSPGIPYAMVLRLIPRSSR